MIFVFMTKKVDKLLNLSLTFCVGGFLSHLTFYNMVSLLDINSCSILHIQFLFSSNIFSSLCSSDTFFLFFSSIFFFLSS